jgi:Tfp pilus assembly protein PilF
MTKSDTPIRLKKQQALQYLKSNNFEEAAKLLQYVIKHDTQDQQSCLLLSSVYAQTGRFNEAVECGKQAVQINPLNPLAHHALAYLYETIGDFGGAEKEYKVFLEFDENNIDILNHLAVSLSKQYKYQEAIDTLEKARAIDNTNPDTLANLCLAHRLNHSPGTAISIGKILLRQNPGSVKTHRQLALSCIQLGQLEAAKEHAETIIEIDPDNESAFNILGIVAQYKNDDVYAEALFKKALSINSDFTTAEINLAHLYLAHGNLKDGWKFYRARPSQRKSRNIIPPEFLPDDLTNKRIVLHWDQGIGDEIFFLRFADLLKQRGAWVGYMANMFNRKLASILARISSLDEVIYTGDMPVDIDYSFMVSDLPLVLKIHDINNVPPPVPVEIDKEKLIEIRHQLGNMPERPLIGLTWRAGDKISSKILYKEVPLTYLVSATRKLNANFVILQRMPAQEEIDFLAKELNSKPYDFSFLNDDLEGMLCLLSMLDEYITVSNTNVHLAASIGLKCRLLAPFPPEWRWMSQGATSPWFPGTEIYRQSPSGDWQQCIHQLTERLSMKYA